MDRNDRDRAAFHDAFESAAERQERAGSGDLSFRENADDFAVVERLTRAAQGAQDDPRSPGRGNRDDPHNVHQPFEQRMSRVGGIDHKADRAIEAGNEEKAVDERHVVGHQQRPAGLRHIGRSDDSHPVERFGQENENETDEGAGDQPQGPEGADEGSRGRREQNAGGGEAE